LILSCEDNIEFKEPKAVLHSLIFEGESPKIILSQTLDPFPEESFNIIYFDQPFSVEEYNANISITITCDDKVYDNFEMESQAINLSPDSRRRTASSEINYFIDKSLIPEAGKEYIIEINEIPSVMPYEIGLNNLRSIAYIPEKIPISIKQETDVINYEFPAYSDEYYEYNNVYTLSFDDPGDSDNYYYLMLSTVSNREDFSMDTVSMDQLRVDQLNYNHSSLTLSPLKLVNTNIEGLNEYNDESSYSGLPGFLFNDEIFNGQSKSIRLELFNYNQDGTSYVVAELMHISKEYYDYYMTIQKQTSSQNDIFAEPTQLYTNIEGGIGIFAGASLNLNYILMENKPE
jgi:hypothetical protein